MFASPLQGNQHFCKSIDKFFSASLSLLKSCKSLAQVQLLHQQLLVRGLDDVRTTAEIAAAYIDADSPSSALSALERIPPNLPAVFWWNSLIRRDVRHGSLHNVLHLYRRMRRLGWSADGYTYPFVLKACGELPSFTYGSSVHAVSIVEGFDSNVFVCNAIITMYGRCGPLDYARQVFDELTTIRIDDLVSWNSIGAVYLQNGDPRSVLDLFARLNLNMNILSDQFRPDAVSLVNALPACASIRNCMQGKEIHAYAMRSGLVDDVFVANAILDMYAKCNLMDEAMKVFHKIDEKDVVSWNSMVTGYSQIGRCEEALRLFEKMQDEEIETDVVTWSAVIAGYAQRDQGFEAINVFRQMQLSKTEPNPVTLVSLLSGCAAVGALRQGKETHCYVIKRMFKLYGNDGESLMKVTNGLIDMYSKCKSTNIAQSMFDSIEPPTDRNVVTWTAIIGGYAQHGDANQALNLFSSMLNNETNPILPNPFTISCVLMACARLSALRSGKQIHAHIIRIQYRSGIMYAANCLIDMYSKCGDVDTARKVFDNMSHRNDVSWTSLMTGYGMFGRGLEALEVFENMRRIDGIVIDDVSFIVVLYACSHSGLVEEGIRYFNRMKDEFGVVPKVEHYACMVDLLGRSGRFDEVTKIIEEMPMEPSSVVWVALLSACRTHGKVELGEFAANKLTDLRLEHDGSYTLLSNLYANVGRWKDVARIRLSMKNAGIRKRPGCSWIQGKNGTTASFYVGDRSHPLAREIYQVLADLIERVKVLGYVPQTDFDLHDVDDEEKGNLLFEHSEKLALAYGVMTSTPGMAIRITKNLRVCGDCHIAFSYISRIVDHDIILRDSSRFHHFKDGSCSCKGYW
ncbi:pentatricopeptide repeat-containing protein At5g16860 [Impatiens glandulifera]|uniref:pentatricopeptide repeat-containing protein At5g16860 n=1 Tax=Impatiens glandulifera TaxID=253017 RepID=UPI001FB16E11|nr:pentatricopeptide repeat-containing protein At5g16860 [Impatiens glandulifera]